MAKLSEKCLCGHILMRHAAVSAGVHGGKCGGFVRIGGKSQACACEAFITPEDALTLESLISTGEITITQEVSIEEAIRQYPDREGEIRAVATNGGVKWPWTAYGEGPTLARLQAMLEVVPRLPKFPPYYRCNINTYYDLKKQFARKVPMSEFPAYMQHLSAVEVRVDYSVPEGEFLPPEGWEP